MSETNFYKRISDAQKELVAPKGQFNSFGKYNYRSAEDILNAVKPLNEKHDLVLFLIDELVLIGDRYYIKAIARLIDINDEKNIYEVPAFARESEMKKGMDEMQITGTASSYARKYALNGLYLIDDTKDADTDEYQKNTNKPTTNKKQEPAPPKQVSKAVVLSKFKLAGGTDEQFTDWYAKQSSAGVSHNQMDDFFTSKIAEKNV